MHDKTSNIFLKKKIKIVYLFYYHYNNIHNTYIYYIKK